MSDLEQAVVLAAIAYEEAWTRYAHLSRPDNVTEAETVLAKANAHQALLDAVRALVAP